MTVHTHTHTHKPHWYTLTYSLPLTHTHPHTFRGQNILHILAKYAKENASGIFSMMLEVSPNFPVDLPDADGNTRKLFYSHMINYFV